MARGYSWEDNSYGEGAAPASFLSKSYGFAVFVSVFIGIAVFAGIILGAGQLRILLGLAQPIEIKSRAFNVEQIEVSASPLPEIEKEEIVPEVTDASELLSDVEELIPELDNTELDISPEISQPEIALEASIPLDAGEEFGELLEPVAAPKVDHVLDQIGRTENLFQEAATGQIMVEEGSVTADIKDPDALLEDMASGGSGGLSDEGLPSGYASIDGLLQMASSELSRSRAALPSDLLFEYDSAQLRETARLGLLKLAMLIDRNPEMYCILEGHSDLFGGASYNLTLSQKRAQAVKSWLVESMQLNGEQIVVKGYGSNQPKVAGGSIEEQALNRRVDILMRKELPVAEEVIPQEERVKPVEPAEPQPLQREEPSPEVVPLRALRVDDEEEETLDIVQPLRALPVED